MNQIIVNPNRPDGEPAVWAYEDRHDYELQLKAGPSLPASHESEVLPSFIRLHPDGEYEHGITDEQLLEVLIDRVEYFQKKLPCEENEKSLFHLREALAWKHARTSNRRHAGVEGTRQAH